MGVDEIARWGPALGKPAASFDGLRYDGNAILGEWPEIAGLFLANGFSGHGMQHAPGAGRGLAELILHGRFQTLDLGALGFARLLAGRPLREENVIG